MDPTIMLGFLFEYSLFIAPGTITLAVMIGIFFRLRAQKEKTAAILADWHDALDEIDNGTPAHVAIGRIAGPWGWRRSQ